MAGQAAVKRHTFVRRRALIRHCACVALLGVLLLSCHGRPAGPARVGAQAPTATEWWLTLRGGRLEETGEPRGPQPAAAPRAEADRPDGAASGSGDRFAPWTVQARIADLLPWRDRLCLAVNGYGIAALPPAGPPRPEYLYDPLLFGHRTITRLLPRGEELLCHLYFNSLLNTTRAEDLKVQGISLLSLSLPDATFRPVPLPFQTAHPEWEAVGFLSDGDGRYLFEWKLSESRRTRFLYTAYDPLSGEESTVQRPEFLQAWRFRGIEDRDLPAALAALLRAARETLAPAAAAPAAATAVQFTLRGDSGAEVSRYVWQPDGFSAAENTRLVEVPLIRTAGVFHALLPDGTLLSTRRSGTAIQRLRLPALPDGYRYAGFLLHGTRLLAAWEERRFFEVGEAGVFIRDFSQ